MGIGVSLILIAVGAILTWAVTDNVSNVDLSTVGVILMVVGLAGGLISLMFWSSWGGFGGYRRETVVHDGRQTESSSAERSGRGRQPRPRHFLSLGMIPPMAPPEPRIESLANCAVITLSGELDAFDAPDLRETFEEVLEAKPRVVVLDLAAVTFLDSTVLGAIVGLLRRVREAGSELRTVLPDTTARRIFEITNLVAALDVWPSRAEAIALALGRGEALAHADDGALRRAVLVDAPRPSPPSRSRAPCRSRPALRMTAVSSTSGKAPPAPSSSTDTSIASGSTSKTTRTTPGVSRDGVLDGVAADLRHRELEVGERDLAHRHLHRDAGEHEPARTR